MGQELSNISEHTSKYYWRIVPNRLPSSHTLQQIINDALDDHGGTSSIEGRCIAKFGLADNIDGLAGRDQARTHQPGQKTRQNIHML